MSSDPNKNAAGDPVSTQGPYVRPAWFDPTVEPFREMLVYLRALRVIQRNPRRGERCPGIGNAQERSRTRNQRPQHELTNVDYLIDFTALGTGFPEPYNWCLGSIARPLMPGPDHPDIRTPVTHQYIASLPLDWSTRAACEQQFQAWRGPTIWAAKRCGADQDITLDLLRIICFDDAVDADDDDFPSLMSAIRARNDAINLTTADEDDDWEE